MTLARSRPAQGRPLEPWQDPAARPFVRIAGVTRKYGDIYAVDNVSLDIYRGEFFALLGPSGCGKTTLLRMLAGFDRPTSGRIEIDGQDMSAVPPWRRPVNMMFQSYALFPHMTVGQNVAFGLKQDRVPKDELKRRVEEALALVRLDAFAGRRPDQLSGGQRQRVALARAIAKRPKLVLLDEPLAALDKKLRETTQFELVSIQEKLGITFVIVTHDQEEAMTVSTRMAIMRDGQVAQMGPPAEIYEYPDSRFVADFVGDVNLLEARVVEAGSQRHAPGLPRRGLRDRHRPRRAGRGRRDHVGGDPAREVRARDLAARRHRRQLHGRPRRRHRLSGRRLDLPCAAGEWGHHPRHRRQPPAPDRAPGHLGGRGLAAVAARRRHRPQVMIDRILRGAGGRLLVLIPYAWLLVFFLVPFAIVLKISFSESAIAVPPYLPLWELVDEAGEQMLRISLNLSNYLRLLEDSLYVRAYLNSLRIAATATVLTLLVGFPMAYAMARTSERWRPMLLMLVILPFWTSFLIRVYAWIGILKDEGLLNAFLIWTGLISAPLHIYNTETAVLIGIVYSYLPFMILPLYANLEKHDPALIEAAVDLGCPPWKAFWLVTVPLALPGIIAGSFLVFIPAVGEFVIPDLLGGSQTLMIGRTLWLDFFQNRDWPTASAVAVLLLLVLVVPILIFQRVQTERGAS